MQRPEIKRLNPSDITSEVFVIAPSQIEYISQIFGTAVANSMNMRPFASKITQLAQQALRHALTAAKTQGAKQ